MLIIQSLTYDHNFVDNVGNPQVLNPQIDPCIKFTAIVIDSETGTRPRDPVLIQWKATRDAVAFYDANGRPLHVGLSADQTMTDHGVTSVYTTCSYPAIVQITATIVNTKGAEEDDNGVAVAETTGSTPMLFEAEGSIGREKKSDTAYKTVVFCTIQSYPKSKLPRPSMWAGSDIEIPYSPDLYASPSRVDRDNDLYKGNMVVAWMATFTTDQSTQEEIVTSRHLLTPFGMLYDTLCNKGYFDVPYQYMTTDDGGGNIIQYLVAENPGSATASDWNQFSASGTAYAMPDPDRTKNSLYPVPVYVDRFGTQEWDKTSISESDFVDNGDGGAVLQFCITPWDDGNPEGRTSHTAPGASTSNANDVIDIYLYLNGYQTGSDEIPISQVVPLGSYRYGDLDSGMISIRRSIVDSYGSYQNNPGRLLLTYQVNDGAWSQSRFWDTYFDGSGGETEKAGVGGE
jgi:hypothetical protein